MKRRILTVLVSVLSLMAPHALGGQSHSGIIALTAAMLGADPAGPPAKAIITFTDANLRVHRLPSDDQADHEFMEALLVNRVSSQSLEALHTMYPEAKDADAKTFIYDACSFLEGVYDKELSAIPRWDGFSKESPTGHFARVSDLTNLVLRLSGGKHIQVEMRLVERHGKIEAANFAHVLDANGKIKVSTEVGRSTSPGQTCGVLPALLKEIRKDEIAAILHEREIAARKLQLDTIKKLNKK